MGDDPSKRMFYPSAPGGYSHYPPGHYPPPPGPPGHYPPPPGHYPPPPGIYPPPPHMPGYPQPHQPIQGGSYTAVYHPPAYVTHTTVVAEQPPVYSSLVSNVRAKIGSIGSMVHTEASRTKLWNKLKVSQTQAKITSIGSVVHTKISRTKLWNRLKGYSWVATTPSSCMHLEGSAVVAGFDTDQSPLWVGRANHDGDLLPCKIRPRHQFAYVSYEGNELFKNDIDVLCADPSRIRWLPSSNGLFPHNAVIGGHTKSGETLYIGRAHHHGSLCPGKIHPSHRCMYIPYGGQEVRITSYECLLIS